MFCGHLVTKYTVLLRQCVSKGLVSCHEIPKPSSGDNTPRFGKLNVLDRSIFALLKYAVQDGDLNKQRRCNFMRAAE